MPSPRSRIQPTPGATGAAQPRKRSSPAMAAKAGRAAAGFLSCDWGTSAFRLRLVEGPECTVRAELRTEGGIAAVHAAWERAAGGGEAHAREEFMRAFLQREIRQLASCAARSLHGVPVVISGMATSSLGLRELRYARLPVAVHGTGLITEALPAETDFPHSILLISGASTSDDVMRGEETKLVGALAGMPPRATAQVALLPGTHSKHVWIEGGQVTSFRTYMSGEFFELLSRHSILRHSLGSDSSGQGNRSFHRAGFERGVREGARENLLHAGFTVRARDLLGTAGRADAREYLSGLVLGAELKELLAIPALDLVLVAQGELAARYQMALEILGHRRSVSRCDADEALIRGQHHLGRRAGVVA